MKIYTIENNGAVLKEKATMERPIFSSKEPVLNATNAAHHLEYLKSLKSYNCSPELTEILMKKLWGGITEVKEGDFEIIFQDVDNCFNKECDGYKCDPFICEFLAVAIPCKAEELVFSKDFPAKFNPVVHKAETSEQDDVVSRKEYQTLYNNYGKVVLELDEYKANQQAYNAEIARYQKAIEAQEKRCNALQDVAVEAKKQAQETYSTEEVESLLRKIYFDATGNMTGIGFVPDWINKNLKSKK